MNWKKPVFMLGAVLMCTSLLVAAVPATDITGSQNAIAQAPVAVQTDAALKGASNPSKFNTEKARNLLQQQALSTTSNVLLNTRDVPVNDMCADAIAIFDGVTAFSTIDATTDGPTHAECMFDGQTYFDIWYTYTATQTGTLIVSTCSDADYDTDLVAYDGCDCMDLVLAACNDDMSGCDGYTSEITFPVVEGYCYLIRVGSYSSSTTPGMGNLTLSYYQEPLGACCDEGLNCIATNTEPECDALDGTWYLAQDCSTFVCPDAIGGDDCEDAVEIYAPYPVTVPGTNIGMTLDCPGLLDWNAMWYLFELPYASNDVTIVLTASGLYSVGIVVMDDCLCDDYTLMAYSFAGDTVTMTVNLAGPGAWYFPAYAVDDLDNPLDFTVTFDVVEHEACILECEPNEDEVVCYDEYDDVTNAGCNSEPPTFQTLECGETMCGTSGVFPFAGSTYRDMDWFQVTLAEAGLLTWSGIAEFPLGMWIMPDGCPASVLESGTAPECTQLTLSAVVEAGTYIVVISPSDWDPHPCGLKWEATVSCGAVMGACCTEDGAVCENTLEGDCTGDWYIGEDCATFDCPVPCPDVQVDIEILTDNYGSETSWEITDNTSGAVLLAGGPLESNTLYNERFCMTQDDCVDFTIYDSYGDGICCSYGNGYYEVYLDGDLVGSGGEFNDVETVDMIGYNCEFPLGACCVELECVATNYEAECDALGGSWYIGEECPAFECPLCYDFEVTAPYTSEVMTTCGMGDDCSPDSQYNDTEDIVFKVTIPCDGLWNFNTCLLEGFDTWMALGTDCCLEDLAYNDDACGVQSEIVILLDAGTYYVDIEGYSTCGDFILEITQEEECILECEPNEDEVVCYDEYDDVTNAGCNSEPPTFQTLECGETMCGTSGVFPFGTSTYRDMDWFQVTMAEGGLLTWSGIAEFPLGMWIMYDGCPASVIESGTADDCTQLTLSAVVEAGTYIVVISPSDWGPYPCGAKWEATVSCGAVMGACCTEDGAVCENTLEDDCTGDWYIGEDCATFECPTPCEDCTVDLVLFTDNYASETSWQITDSDTGAVLMEAVQGTLSNNTLYNVQYCLADGACVDFTIYDSYGDGICCAYGDGYYEVWLDDVLIGSGGEFLESETVADICCEGGMCGDLDGDGDVDIDDFWLFLDSFGTCVGDLKYIVEADLDEDGCITLVDYGMWIQCWRDANPGATFRPHLQRANVKSASSGKATMLK